MKKHLIIAVFFGILAALFTALYLNSLENAYKNDSRKVKVLAAKTYINQGTFIDNAVVEEIMVPKDYVQPKALGALKELYGPEGGKIFMSIVPFEKGEQITATKLSLLGLDTGISAVVPDRKRAVTLLMDPSLVHGVVKPGNRIDVVGILQYEDKSGKVQEAAFTLLQNTLVLAVGGDVLGAAAGGEDGAVNGGTKNALQDRQPTGAIPVSIAVSMKEAETVLLAAERGAIRLSLRPIGDESTTESRGTNLRDISKEIAQPVKDPGAPADMSPVQAKDIEKNQQEVLELLKKYRKY